VKTLPTTIRDDLARSWNLDPSQLRFLGGGEDWSDGTLFSAPAPSSVPGEEVVLKILDFPLADRDALGRAEDRIRFVRFFGDQGCRMVTPRPDLTGALFQTREQDKLYLAYAYTKVAGRPATKTDHVVRSGAFFSALGSELGRLHAAWESRGPVVLPDGTGTESTALKGWRDEMAFFRTWCQVDAVRTAWDHLQSALERLPIEPRGYGFVHNDAHVANFLWNPEQHQGEPSLAVIDFDVANYHWYLNDCAVALYSFGILGSGGIETEKGPDLSFVEQATRRFWEGYQRHKDPRDLGLDGLELFLQYRRCLLFMPFQEQTAQHPAWRRRWIDRILAADQRLFGTPSEDTLDAIRKI